MGELYSTLCALLWAVAVILFRRSGEHLDPLALNVFKNAIALALFVATLPIFGVAFVPAHPAADWLILLGSGAVGIGVADSMLFASLNRLGAGRMAIVDCAYSPSIMICSILWLHEPFRPILILSVGLMVAAILIGAWHPEKRDAIPKKDLHVGVALGIGSVLLMAIGIVVAKPVLERVDVLWATPVRLAGGLLLLSFLGISAKHRSSLIACFRPGPHWKVALPATVIGSYAAMFMWLLGMKHTHTATAGVLNQLSTVFVLVLATWMLQEPLTGRRVAAMTTGFVAAVIAVA